MSCRAWWSDGLCAKLFQTSKHWGFRQPEGVLVTGAYQTSYFCTRLPALLELIHARIPQGDSLYLYHMPGLDEAKAYYFTAGYGNVTTAGGTESHRTKFWIYLKPYISENELWTFALMYTIRLPRPCSILYNSTNVRRSIFSLDCLRYATCSCKVNAREVLKLHVSVSSSWHTEPTTSLTSLTFLSNTTTNMTAATMDFRVWLKLKFERGEYKIHPDHPSAVLGTEIKDENVASVLWTEGEYWYIDRWAVFCRIKPNNTGPGEIIWEDQTEWELIHTRFLIILPRYDPIFLHPEFPHLISGRQD